MFLFVGAVAGQQPLELPGALTSAFVQVREEEVA